MKGLGPAIMRVVLLVISACGVFALMLGLWTSGSSGEAADVKSLSRVYKGAGPGQAAFFTNSFLQKMPFTEPISWHRSTARSSSVSLVSRVNVALFRSKMANEPFSSLFTDTASGNGETAYFKIYHRGGERVVQTTGKLNLANGEFEMQSNSLEQKVDDRAWKHLTNKPFIQFEFEEKR